MSISDAIWTAKEKHRVFIVVGIFLSFQQKIYFVALTPLLVLVMVATDYWR